MLILNKIDNVFLIVQTHLLLLLGLTMCVYLIVLTLHMVMKIIIELVWQVARGVHLESNLMDKIRLGFVSILVLIQLLVLLLLLSPFVCIFVKQEQLECLEIQIQTFVLKSVLHLISEIQLVIEHVLNNVLITILLKIQQHQEDQVILEYVWQDVIMGGLIISQEHVKYLLLVVQQGLMPMKPITNVWYRLNALVLPTHYLDNVCQHATLILH